MSSSKTPTEIKKTGDRELTVTWDNGHVSVFPIRYLRLECMCAGCVSEMTGQRILDPRTVPEDVTITQAHHVGRYGIQFMFSDEHGDGIYTWDRLAGLCPCEECSEARTAGSQTRRG